MHRTAWLLLLCLQLPLTDPLRREMKPYLEAELARLVRATSIKGSRTEPS